jgi:multiple sugar transport system ATP-binding protein
MAQLDLQNLRKSYGTVDVIKGVDLTIKNGEFVALVGPSGCGKSTMLRMIAGLEDITSGEISIGDRVVNDLDPKDRDIAMVFQNYALYPHKSVEDNMGFSLKLRGETKETTRKAVAEAAELLGLTEYLDRLPRALSGGQRQRVAMGRAIVRNPSVFLFDEPLSNLDASLRVQMRAEIRALHDRLSATSVFVTHDQVEALTMADKVVILRGGVIEQVGAPMEVYERPANQFVASFIGSPSMNQIRGSAQNGSIRISDGFNVPCDASIAGDVIWGMRPEHIDFAAEGTDGAVGADVVRVENTGLFSMIETQVGDVRLSVVDTDGHSVARGDKIWLDINHALSHVFDEKTGQRL